MTEDADFVSEWAKIESELKASAREILKKHGYTWPAFIDLQDKATQQVTAEQTQTEFGVVQKIEKPVFVHKGSQPMGTRSRIKLVTRDG